MLREALGEALAESEGAGERVAVAEGCGVLDSVSVAVAVGVEVTVGLPVPAAAAPPRAPRMLALPVTVPVLEAVEVELRVEATEGVEVGEAV